MKRIIFSLFVIALFGRTLLASNETQVIVALGDSLSAGYNLAQQDSFPSQLEQMLKANGHNVKMFNASVSGDTTKAGVARLNWILNDKNHLVIVELGANDFLRGVKPDETYLNLDKILNELTKAKRKILFIGMKAPPNLGEDFQKKYDKIFEDLQKKYGKFKGFRYDKFFLEGVYDKPELLSNDNMHPNKAGLTFIAERLYPVIEELLKEK